LGRERVAGTAEIPPDTLRRVEVAGVPVCLAHTQDGGFYAINDVCTHEEYSLSEGELWEFEVECPQHGSRFDVRTGAVRFLPAVIPAQVYAVEVVDGDVYVNV